MQLLILRRGGRLLFAFPEQQHLQCGISSRREQLIAIDQIDERGRLGDNKLATRWHIIEPVPELTIEIIEITKFAAEEEARADVAERPLHFALIRYVIGGALFIRPRSS